MRATEPNRTDARAPLSRFWMAAGILLSLALLIPIWYFQYLPLNDWPNHLASVHLLLEWQAGQTTYIVPNPQALLPNSAVFWAMRLLGPLTGVETAGRLVLSLSILLSVWGAAYFARSIDARLEPFGLAMGGALAYNWFFLMGFLNFALSLGLFLVAAGYWMRGRTRGAERSGGLRAYLPMLGAAVLGALLALTHLVSGLALAGFIVWMRGVEWVGRAWRERRARQEAGGRGAGRVDGTRMERHGGENGRRSGAEADLRAELAWDAAFLLPVLLIGTLSIGSLLSGESGAERIVWSTPFSKLGYALLAMPSPAIFFVGALVLGCYLLIWLAQNQQSWRPDWRWLVPAGVMLALAILLPENTASWQFAAPRLWPFFYYFLAAALFAPLVRTAAGAGLARELAVAILLLALGQTAMLAMDWQNTQASVREVVEAGRTMRAGASALPIGQGFAQTGAEPGVSPYFHAWGYWVMEREVFVPYLFTWGYSPIQFRNESAHGAGEIGGWLDRLAYRAFDAPTRDTCQHWKTYYEQDFNWTLVSREYDYVVLRRGECENESLVPPPFEKTWAVGNVSVFENRAR